MRLFSINNPQNIVSLRAAVLQGVASDGGLFLPTLIPTLPPDFFRLSRIRSFHEIAFQAAQALFQGSILNTDLKEIIETSLNFDPHLVRLDQSTLIFELFHGESTFNDFSARFLAALIKRYTREQKQPILIFTIAAGDVETAVFKAFLGIEGVKICTLYPSAEIKESREDDSSATSQNLIELEIQGSVYDCQILIKEALRDGELRNQFLMTTANALNIAWLIPQLFYFLRAYAQLHHRALSKPLVFAMPGGDLDALTAGAMTKKIGLPVSKFIVGLNACQDKTTRLKSDATVLNPISTALENCEQASFQRLRTLYGSIEKMQEDIFSVNFTDDEAHSAARELYKRYEYRAQYQTAVGYLGLEAFRKTTSSNNVGIVLGLFRASPLKQKKRSINPSNTFIKLPKTYETFKHILRYNG